MKILCGDVFEKIREIPDQSIQCCVTSPPYWGLRDYGVDGQLGLEKTPEEYVEKMVEVFREVKRVLRDDGTLWLNLGDSYAGSSQAGDKVFGNSEFNKNRFSYKTKCLPECQIIPVLKWDKLQPSRALTLTPERKTPTGLKPKDLIGIPWRVAFALQADGWCLRSDIIWAKKNCMPESVTDRPTRSHEYVFLLSKSAQYHYDFESIKEQGTESSQKRLNQSTFWNQQGGEKDTLKGNRFCRKTLENLKEKQDKQRGHLRRHDGFNDRWDMMSKEEQCSMMRNKRDVWTVATKPYKEAHFATYPPELIEPCILAGCPEGGIVLDPFAGSGTTGEVAIVNNRDVILVELNPEYIKLIEKRCEEAKKKRRQKETGLSPVEQEIGQLTLFDTEINDEKQQG